MSQTTRKILVTVPGIVTGLYLGRILSELWADWNGSTETWLAVLLTALCVLICGGLFSRLPLRQTWPTLFLGLYVLYPESSSTAAGLVALLTLLTWWQNRTGTPVPVNRTKVFLIPLVLLSICFLLYLRTLAPDLLPADNGEFQLVATNLGVAHPPGFPLYTILAHVMTWLPLGPTPAYRVNLFSAVTSTLALAAVYGTVFVMTKRHLAAIASVLALATATTFWAQATTANIRSMTALFTALIFLTAVLFYQAISKDNNNGRGQKPDRYLVLFAFALSLGVTHHASLAFIGVIAAIFLLVVDPSILRSPGRWWRPALAFLLGLLPLLYLPLRSSATARGASPTLGTWSGFLEHALALGFRGDLFVYLEPAFLLERVKIMGNVLTFQFSPWILAAMAIGLILLVVQEWRLAFLFGGSALLFTFITATYRAPQTVEYMLPAYVAMSLLLGVAGGGVVISRSSLDKSWWAPLGHVLTAMVIVLAVGQFLDRYDSYAKPGTDFTAREYAEGLFEDAPPDSLILANWHWATPLWYLQEVEGIRPDIEVRYVFPKGEPYAYTWAKRVQDGLANGRDVIATNFDSEAFSTLPAAEPIGDAFLFRQDQQPPELEAFVKLGQVLGERIQVLGYKIDNQELSLGEEILVTLAWEPVDVLDSPVTLFAHLVAENGGLSGQDDQPARATEQGITLTQFRIVPFAGTQPGQFDVLIGAYDLEALPAEDGALRFPAAAVQLLASQFPPATINPLERDLVSEQPRRLVGYDWDESLSGQSRLYLHWQYGNDFLSEAFDEGPPSLPLFAGPWGVASNRWSFLSDPEKANYVPMGDGIVWSGNGLDDSGELLPGQDLVIEQHFQSGRPIMRDLVVSVRLIGFEEDGYHWSWWDLNDAIPAMGAVPTLKWIAGSQVTSPHFVAVDESAAAGQEVGGALTLYDAFTGRVLPILDDRLVGEYGWIPLGESRVKASE